MRKLAPSVALLVACAALPSAAGASHSNGQGPKQDLVQGTGNFVLEVGPLTQTASFHVNANSGPAGEDPRGKLWLDIALNGERQTELRGRVTCVSADGNTATVGAEIERGEGPAGPLAGRGVVLFFEDNGSGSSAPPDQSNGLLLPTPPAVCPPASVAVLPFQQGNFVVHDAVSAP